jgi:hypothetical protein
MPWGWGCKWGLVGVGSHSVIDETPGTSRQPGFPLNGGWKRGRGGWGGHPESRGGGFVSGGWWGLGSRSVVDEMLGASRQPGFPLDGGWKRGRGGWGGHPECCGVGLRVGGW